MFASEFQSDLAESGRFRLLIMCKETPCVQSFFLNHNLDKKHELREQAAVNKAMQ